MAAAKTLRHGLGTRSVRRLRRRSLEQSVIQPVRGLAAVQVFVSKLDNFLGTELFSADQPVIVGRHRDAHLRLVAEAVSREHLRLSLEAGKVFVEDLGSANGTLLNRRRLSARVEIRPADAIQIGPYTLRVRALIPRPERVASGISDADTSVEAVLAVDGSNGTTDAALDVARAVDWRLYEDAVRRATGGMPARNVIHLSVVGDVPVARPRTLTRSDSQVPLEPMDDEHGGSSAATGRVDTRDVPATSDKLTPPSPITLDAGIVARIEELERLVERWSEPSRVIRAHEDSAVTLRPDEAAIRGLGASLLGASLLGAAVGAPIGDGPTDASNDTRAGSITRPDRGDSHLDALAASVLRAEDLLAFTDASDVVEIPIIPDLASDAPSALGAGFSVVPSQAMGTGTHDNPAEIVLEESTERSTEIETATPAGTPTPILKRYPSVPMDPAAIARSLLAPAGAHDLGPRGPVSLSRRAPPPPPPAGTGVVLRGIAPARGSSVAPAAPAPRVVDPASLAPTPVQSLAPEAPRAASRIPAELVTPTGRERALPLAGAPSARRTPAPVSAQPPSRGTPAPVSAQPPSRGTPAPVSAQPPSAAAPSAAAPSAAAPSGASSIPPAANTASRGTPAPVSAQSPSRGTPAVSAPRPSAPPPRRPSVAPSPLASSPPAASVAGERAGERFGPKPAAPRLRSLSTPGGSVAAALEDAAASPRRRAPSLPPMPALVSEAPGLRPVSIASARAGIAGAAERAPVPARPASAGVFGALLQASTPPASPSGGNAVVSRSAARAPGAPRQASVRVTPAAPPPPPAPPATTSELEAVVTARIAEGDMIFDGVEVVARQGERRLDIATLRKNGEQYVLGHVTPQGAHAPTSGHPGLRLLRITDQRMVDLVFPRDVAGHLVRDGETVMLRELTEGRKYSCLRLRPRDVITVILGEGAERVSYHVRFLRAPRQISMARPALGA